MALADLVDIFFPPTCVGCARVLPGRAAFCATCAPEVERVPSIHCLRCCEPGVFKEDVCPRCHLRPPPFSRAFAPFAHAGPISRAVHQMKYEDHPELAAPLGELLAVEARGFLVQAPVEVVPVPLHPARLRERRYDQASLLAQSLARAAGLHVLTDVLVRERRTERQVGRTEAEREANVDGAFGASRDLTGARLLLVDDVFTTGATARAAAAALHASGAVEVQVLTLARAYSL
ncbi:MAG: ComF family protein [Myxococcaceae bacterium]|nr:ComF family protein [Myxococcaceae bacterium]MCI0670860.1 ComF family protein [Myxococcaceae bacterium]